MRAMPIILDLIILLTVFALTLFYTALGNSAPSEDKARIVMFEVSSTLQNGGATLGPSGLRFGAWLTVDGVPSTAGEVLPLSHTADGTQRFLVRNALDGAEINFVVRAVDLAAFDATGWTISIMRAFPGGETRIESSPVGRLTALSMVVSQ